MRGPLAATLILPLILVVLLGIIQSGVWLHGRQSARAAAQVAAEAERVAHPIPGAGERAAQRVASHGGITDLGVSITRTGETVTVTVTGKTMMFVDLGYGRFSETAVLPVERVTTP